MTDIDGVVSSLLAWAGMRDDIERRTALAAGLKKKLAQGTTLEDLERALGAGSDILHDLITDASVPETYFFRHPEQFELLASELVGRLAGDGIRAWSAGCSTGEEAYSIAACLLATSRGSVTVLGTDIVPSHLERATAAEYGEWSRRSLTADLFPVVAPSGPSRFRVRDDVKRVTSFRCENLLEGPPDGELFDLIFCRNVLLYLTAEAASTAIDHLISALAPGGFIILGPLDVAATPSGLRRVLARQPEIFELSTPSLRPSKPHRSRTIPPRFPSRHASLGVDSGDDESRRLLLLRAERLRRPLPTTEPSESRLEVATFRVGEQTVAIPLPSLVSIAPFRPVTPVPRSSSRVAGIARFEDKIVAVFDLAALLGAEHREAGDKPLTLLIDTGGSLVATLVPEVPEATSLSMSAVSEARPVSRGVSTVTDGARRVSLLDPSRIFSEQEA
jgi:chemotaxis methyl-accepting protein methylase/chemotaxis signal transduction protein